MNEKKRFSFLFSEEELIFLKEALCEYAEKHQKVTLAGGRLIDQAAIYAGELAERAKKELEKIKSMPLPF